MTTFLEGKDNKVTGIYRGLVLDNNDPQKLGRIKIKAFPMFNAMTAEEVPWAVPAFGLFEGAGVVTPNDRTSGGIGMFSIPKVDTYVFLFFEAGDIYQPVYFAEAQDSAQGLPTQRLTNYPNRKVLRTRSGIEVYIDTQINEIKLYHPTGTQFIIDENGKVTINVVDAVDETVDKTVDVYVKGNITVTSDSNIVIQGADVHINP
jgi:hypothetical protein